MALAISVLFKHPLGNVDFGFKNLGSACASVF